LGGCFELRPVGRICVEGARQDLKRNCENGATVWSALDQKWIVMGKAKINQHLFLLQIQLLMRENTFDVGIVGLTDRFRRHQRGVFRG
jgi:hypothetical protein